VDSGSHDGGGGMVDKGSSMVCLVDNRGSMVSLLDNRGSVVDKGGSGVDLGHNSTHFSNRLRDNRGGGSKAIVVGIQVVVGRGIIVGRVGIGGVRGGVGIGRVRGGVGIGRVSGRSIRVSSVIHFFLRETFFIQHVPFDCSSKNRFGESTVTLSITSCLLFGLLGSSLGLGIACDFGANLLASWARVQLSELGSIELWCLQDLHLADEDILEWVDSLAGLHDVLANELWHELLDSLHQLDGGDLLGHDINHLLADGTDLGRLCVRCLADLEWALLGEANAEASEDEAIDSLHVDVGLDEGLPLAHQGAELVSGEVHAPEAAESLLALDILHTEAHLAVGIILVLVEVSEGDFQDAALELVGSDLGSLGAGHESLADDWVGEKARSLDIIPILHGERIDDFLLGSLLSLSETLVLTDSHFRDFLCYCDTEAHE